MPASASYSTAVAPSVWLAGQLAGACCALHCCRGLNHESPPLLPHPLLGPPCPACLSSLQVQQYRHLDERYHSMAEENRQLYNTVQDLRGSIRVFCRVRPRGATGDGSAAMVEVGG